MNISSVNLESYFASISQLQTINTQKTETQTDKKDSDKDSYISSISDVDTAIPSGTYNAQGLEVGVGNVSTASETSTSQQGGGAGGVGGGGDSSDSDEDTETEIVTINGVTYLQITTTDENGNTTVTRTQIGSSPINNNQNS